MEIKTKWLSEGDRLERLLLICWYITVASAPFGSYLLRIQLPVLGHFFLFRGAVLVTCFVYLIYLIRRRENPFSGLSRVEWAFIGFAVCLVLYGAASVMWTVSITAWVSKFFILCQMLALVFLFLKLCASPEVLRKTVLLIAASTLICAICALVESICGPIFPDSVHRDYVYVFFDKGMYYPVFTFVNPNDACEYLFFSLEVLFLYVICQWELWSEKKRWKTIWSLAAASVLLFFLACVCQGRLVILSLILFVIGLFTWLLMRYKRGLSIFLLFAAFTVFVYIGENYAQVKYDVETKIDQIQSLFKEESDDEPAPERTPPLPNIHASLYTIAPTVTGEGAPEDIARSDHYRMDLILTAASLLMESKGLGVGLGSAEILAAKRMGLDPNGLALHCYPMELFAECGLFAIVPLLVLVFFILKSWWDVLRSAFRRKDTAICANVLFLLFTAAAFPLAVTASSSSRDLIAMWLYLAFIIHSSKKMGDKQIAPEERLS